MVNSNLIVLGAMCSKEIKQSTTKLQCLGSEGIMTVLQSVLLTFGSIFKETLYSKLTQRSIFPLLMLPILHKSNGLCKEWDIKMENYLGKSCKELLNLCTHKDTIINMEWVFPRDQKKKKKIRQWPISKKKVTGPSPV